MPDESYDEAGKPIFPTPPVDVNQAMIDSSGYSPADKLGIFNTDLEAARAAYGVQDDDT